MAKSLGVPGGKKIVVRENLCRLTRKVVGSIRIIK